MSAPIPSFFKMRCWLTALLCLLCFFFLGLAKQALAEVNCPSVSNETGYVVAAQGCRAISALAQAACDEAAGGGCSSSISSCPSSFCSMGVPAGTEYWIRYLGGNPNPYVVFFVVAETFCPDSDGDGVKDPCDACPDNPGMSSLLRRSYYAMSYCGGAGDPPQGGVGQGGYCGYESEDCSRNTTWNPVTGVTSEQMQSCCAYDPGDDSHPFCAVDPDTCEPLNEDGSSDTCDPCPGNPNMDRLIIGMYFDAAGKSCGKRWIECDGKYQEMRWGDQSSCQSSETKTIGCVTDENCNAQTDTDGDGDPDVTDPDDDNDTVPDAADPDDNNDGIPDRNDANGDGVPDDYGTNSGGKPDTSGGGGKDSDGDGVPDVNDPDDDNDGQAGAAKTATETEFLMSMTLMTTMTEYLTKRTTMMTTTALKTLTSCPPIQSPPPTPSTSRASARSWGRNSPPASRSSSPTCGRPPSSAFPAR